MTRKMIAIEKLVLVVILSVVTSTMAKKKSNDSDDNVSEKRLVLHSDVDMAQEIIKLRQEFKTYQENSSKLINSLNNEVSSLNSKVLTMETENRDLKMNILKNTSNILASLDILEDKVAATGMTYVHWGRTSCGNTSEFVYKGYASGRKWDTYGGGTDTLCLPSDPTWGHYYDGNTGTRTAYIYGSEIHVDKGDIFGTAVENQDMPCAVCRTRRASVLIIPGRTNCYSGWTLEYSGYLMAQQADVKGAFDHLCMDQSPESVIGGGAKDGEHVFYLVEGQCGSLPCPPYVHGRELACAVCSK